MSDKEKSTPEPKPNTEQEKIKKDLYRRFSDKGILKQRAKRFGYGFAWIFVTQIVGGAKRFIDFFVSLLVLLFFFPLTLFSIICFVTRSPFIQRTRRVGRWGIEFNEFSFLTSDRGFRSILKKIGVHRFPAFINILKGEMSLVGPRLLSPAEMSLKERMIRKRYNAAPGLISLSWIRKAANVDYATELESDQEYLETHSVRGDMGILFRSIPAVLYGEGVRNEHSENLTILGIPVTNLTMADAVDAIVEKTETQTPHQICFVNADCVNIAFKNNQYRHLLQKTDMVFADGIGMKLAGKFLQQEIKQNVNGTDLFPRLCEKISGTGKGIFFLGARAQGTLGICTWVQDNYPDVTISGAHQGYFEPENLDTVIARIRDSGAEILLVAFGAPQQDLWIARHLNQLNVKVAIGVGGLFDFFSGRIPRAPVWMREIGMEWAYRLYQEPKRMWKRYIVGNVVFLYRVFAAKFSSRYLT